VNGKIPGRRAAIAYWLTPAEPARGFIEQVIIDLARRFNAPVFEPHVTIHVGPDRAGAAEKIISQTALRCDAVALKKLEVEESSEFVKTLFVQFAPSTKLKRLNKIIRGFEETPSDYQLNPHLSLLYKKLSLPARRELPRSISLPFSTVMFDSIKAVRCASPMWNRADVEAWCIVATKSLARGARSTRV
jgi:2'-5' RNA ligase